MDAREMNSKVGLAEALQAYLVEHAPIPVKGGAFNLDTLLPKGKSMSLQMNPGKPEHIFIDGTAVITQPFVIRYRDEKKDDNDIKSEMMRSLNAIGDWMHGNRQPYLGDWLKVSALEQVQSANIAALDDKTITYQAGYVLGYETL